MRRPELRARRTPPGDPPSAYQQALGLLVRRERSRAELGRKLKSRGIDGDEAEAALTTLARQDFQNDERFAGALARTRAAAGYGPVRIRAELGTHGLDRPTIAAALDTCEVDWDALATDAARRRFGLRLADPAIRRKAVELLLRRGFDVRCASGAVRTATAGAAEPESD
ncbi:MAG: regulatory protein RecX [Arenimonas sp.]